MAGNLSAWSLNKGFGEEREGLVNCEGCGLRKRFAQSVTRSQSQTQLDPLQRKRN